MQLSGSKEPLSYDTAFWLLGFLEDDGFKIEELGQVSVELCEKLRALAIIALLSEGDSDKFLHNLIRSGRVRETFLSRLKQAHYQSEHHLASGRFEGLLDSIASGDIELAQRIAWLSPRTWEAQREYEDDFCYAQILHRLVHGVQAASVYQPFIDRFEEVLNGQASARLDVVRALVARSQVDFDKTFETLLQERQDEIAANIARYQFEEPPIVAERQVFIEGLALLRLAGIVGLTTQTEYLYCPSNARLPMRNPVPFMPDDT
jgi:Immunity protein 49